MTTDEILGDATPERSTEKSKTTIFEKIEAEPIPTLVKEQAKNRLIEVN